MATRTQDTVQNVLQIVSDIRGESSVNTGASRIRAVSRAEYDIAKRKLWSWLRVPNATVTGDGGNTYTIGSTSFPMREKGLFEVFVGGTDDSCKRTIIDYELFKTNYNNNSSDKLAYQYYDAATDTYKLFVNPAVDTGTTIYYSYYYIPPKRTLTTDVVVCPSIDTLARLAGGYIFENEDEGELADQYKNEAEQMISELVGLDTSPNVNQIRTFSAVGNKGIGTY